MGPGDHAESHVRILPGPGGSPRHGRAETRIRSECVLRGGPQRSGLGGAAYATAKGALSTLTKALAKEFAPAGIRVNAVSPGTIDTNYHRAFSTDQMLDSVRAATPMGRLGSAEEVADVVVFLCSDQATFMQGQVIEVNGGFLMV